MKIKLYKYSKALKIYRDSLSSATPPNTTCIAGLCKSTWEKLSKRSVKAMYINGCKKYITLVKADNSLRYYIPVILVKRVTGKDAFINK